MRTFFEGTDNVLLITDPTKQAELLLSLVMLSETHVNKDTEDEPAFKFFKREIAKLRDLMRRFYLAIKTYHSGSEALAENQHFFMTEFLETSTYMLLDFCINATAGATDMSAIEFPLPKSEAKAFLQLALEMLAFYLQYKDTKEGTAFNPEERYLFEKTYPATCKMIAYLGGYLQ